MTGNEIIEITAQGSNEFTVRIGERYSDRMCWEEMLAQVVELTHPKITHGRFPMLTDAEWQERYEIT